MAGSAALVFLLMLVAGVPASLVNEKELAALARQARSSTVITSTVVVTATTPTTTTLTTRTFCASTPAGGAPALTSCRRKRQYWEAPIFLALDEKDDIPFQYPIKPTQVLRVEPSAVPEYRGRRPQFVPHGPAYFQPHFAVQPSFEKTPANIRVANPFFGAYKYTALVSLFSSLVNNVLTSTIVSTTTSTTFTSTVTSTSYSSTATFSIGGCIPSGVSICPATG